MSIVYAESKVYINGEYRGNHNVTISAEIGDDMPGRMNVTSGVTQRTGKIEWVLPKSVAVSNLHPWKTTDFDSDFILPKRGDRVKIVMNLSGTDYQVFTGKVDTTKGTFTSVPVTEIIDDIDQLNRIVRAPALRHHLPPKAWNGTDYKHVSLMPNSTLTHLGQMCGFHITPPDTGGHIFLSAPLQGSVLTHDIKKGEVHTASRGSGDPSDLPMFVEHPGGLALTEGHIIYEAHLTAISGLNVPRRAYGMSLLLAPGHRGNFTAYFYLGDAQIRLSIYASKIAVIHVGNHSPVSLGAEDGDLIQFMFHRDGTLKLRCGSKERVVRDVQFPEGAILHNRITVRAYAGAAVYGLQMGYNGTGDYLHPDGFTPNLNIQLGYPYPLHYQRSIRDERALDVIEEIAKSLLASVWIDGEGVLNIVYSRVAHTQATRHTVGTARDIRQISWEDSTIFQANKVFIKYKTTETDWTAKGGGSRVTLWEAPDQEIEAGEEVIWWFGPESDEDYLEPDTWPVLPVTGHKENWEAFLRRDGSFVGFAAPAGSDPSSDREEWAFGTFKLEEVVPWRFKLTVRPTVTCSSHIPKDPSIPRSMWGKPIPVIRGGAFIRQVNARPVVADGGEPTAAYLEHDGHTWITETRAQDMAEYLAGVVQGDQAVLRNVQVFLNPAIKLADIVTLDLGESGGGLQLVGYVLGLKHDVTADTTSLTLRVLRQATPWDYGELATEFATYTEVEDTFTTYADLEANRRAD